MTEKRRSPHRVNYILDLIHLILGVLIVAASAAAFIAPEEHLLFFPLVFFLAAAVSLINGFAAFKYAGRDKKEKMLAAGRFLFGAVLTVLGIVSAVIML